MRLDIVWLSLTGGRLYPCDHDLILGRYLAFPCNGLEFLKSQVPQGCRQLTVRCHRRNHLHLITQPRHRAAWTVQWATAALDQDHAADPVAGERLQWKTRRSRIAGSPASQKLKD